MGRTEDNLKAAFAGESQANRKYLAFARKAEEEGHRQVAKLFRAAAESETVHALKELDALGQVNSTGENLKAAIEGETHEYTEMYPEFIKQAGAESNAQVRAIFYGAMKAEEGHTKLYKNALENLGSNRNVDYYVCQTCGWTAEGKAPDKCPVCGQPKEQFKRIG